MFVYSLLMDTESANKSKVRKRKAALNVSFCVKKERNTVYQKVSTLLQKPLAERSKDEAEFLNNSKDIVQQITLRKAQRQKVKDRAQEYEDPANILAEKCKALAEAVMNSNHLVVYTGAGISTAACIPDYRGTNGIWTLLQQGKDIGLHDLSQAEPTLTHMALYCLYRSGILKHVVSQNCDGLHLRSGIPRSVLSEVHGNMYLEVCSKCKPCNHYLRLFDVTEYTARYSHETLRLCYKCGNPLKDTIVHFGERGKLQWPLNWETACKQADKADVILCLGSSLKVLKRYPWLWCMDKPVKKRPKLYIVNLQWTPKDDHSTLKINGKCDAVIEQMMSHLHLTIPQYVRNLDPIFYHATRLNDLETHTTSRSPIEKVLSRSFEQKSLKSGSEVRQESNSSNSDSERFSSMCSHTQDLTLNIKISAGDADEHVDCARGTDLISTNHLVLTDSVVVKEEIMDTNSDKENDMLSVADDIKAKKSVKDCNVEIKVEKLVVDFGADVKPDGQSTLSVINEKSVELLVPEVTVETEKMIEIETESSMKCELADSDSSKPTNSQLPNLAVVPYLNNANAGLMTGMNLLYGCSLWSDLSLFDALTHQPILIGHSILQWSDMNTHSSLVPYCSDNLTRMPDSRFNQAESVSSSGIAENNDPSGGSSSSTTMCSEVEKSSAENIACSFCWQYYNAKTCLFYASCPSALPFDPNSVCLCCGGDEDEEDQDEQEEDGDKSASKVPNVNPGWFGKGYRKKVKKRK